MSDAVAPRIRDYLAKPTPAGLKNLLNDLEDEEAVTEEDGAALCDLLAWFDDDRVAATDGGVMHSVFAMLQQIGAPEAGTVIRERGMPDLVRIVRALLEPGSDDDWRRGDTAIFGVKIASMYATEEGTALTLEVARRDDQRDGFLWSVIFNIYGPREGDDIPEDKRLHPFARQIVDGLSDPLPEGFVGVAFLDLCNALAIADGLGDGHPFDTPAGRERLEGFLRDTDEENFSYAHSATAALPFLSDEAREQLFPLAAVHPDDGVRTEAAWALAFRGDEKGIELLAEIATDPHRCWMACQYLHELDREDAIPEVARDLDFVAMAEMSNWLQHPQEFGRPPDRLEPFDTRELNWPPTDDFRRVWLFRYEYEPVDEDDEGDIGIGMVGPTTFALFGETTVDLPPEDVYALHCCWELQIHEDPRAPEERTVEAGRKLLDDANPGAGFGA